MVEAVVATGIEGSGMGIEDAGRGVSGGLGEVLGVVEALVAPEDKPADAAQLPSNRWAKDIGMFAEDAGRGGTGVDGGLGEEVLSVVEALVAIEGTLVVDCERLVGVV